MLNTWLYLVRPYPVVLVIPACSDRVQSDCDRDSISFQYEVVVSNMCTFSYKTYDSISMCSLGSLVICGVGGAAIWLGIAQSGGLSVHRQNEEMFDIFDTDSWSGLTWLSAASIGFLGSAVMLAWSCYGKQVTGEKSSRAELYMIKGRRK